MSYIKSSRKQDFIAYRDPLNLIHGRDRRTPTAGGTGKSRTHKGAVTHPGQQSGDPGGRRQHGGGRWRPCHPPRRDPGS